MAIFVGLPMIMVFAYMIYHFIVESYVTDKDAGICIGINRDPKNNC